MSKLQNYFERQANKQMTLHPTAKEYSPLLVLSVVGKIITMLLSVSGGVLYFVGIFKGIYLPLVIFLSGFFLLLIEGLNLFSLETALKMGLRSRFVPSALLGVFSFVLFGISFLITTEGVRQWKAQNTTKKTEITQDFKAEKEQTKKDYSQRISRLQAAIIPLQQFAWKSKEVAKYNSRIDSLEKVLAFQLSNLTQKEQKAQAVDQQKTETKAETFYLLGVALMGAQLVFNVLIAVLYNRIHKEIKLTQRIDEDLNEIANADNYSIFEQYKNNRLAYNQMLKHRLSLVTNSPALSIENSIQKQEEHVPEIVPKENGKIGFINTHEKQEKTHTKSAEPSTYVDTSEGFKNTQNAAKTINYLSKHRQVTKAICAVLKGVSQNISNDEIKQVQRTARNAKHKSESLIRNVFFAAQSVGFEAVKDIID